MATLSAKEFLEELRLRQGNLDLLLDSGVIPVRIGEAAKEHLAARSALREEVITWLDEERIDNVARPSLLEGGEPWKQ